MTKLNRLLQQGEKATGRLTRAQERTLIRNYQIALKAIRGEIAEAYAKYGSNYSDMQKYNRLTNLERSIGKEVAKLTGKNAVNLKKGIAGIFQESYYRTAYALEKTANARLGFGMLNEKTIEASIKNPLDRVGFLQRNRDNQSRLTRQLKEQLTQGLIRGESYQETAKRIKERMDVGATNTIRIAHTENHRAQTQGRKASIGQAKDAGVELVEIWTSTLDDRTREDHQDMDGEKANEEGLFDLDGNMVEGPGMTGEADQDIGCRCTLRAEIKDYSPEVRRRRLTGEEYEEAVNKEKQEAQRDGREPRPVSKSTIEDYRTYNQWKEGRING